ncbi:hypothetical protein [Paenibacillus sp. GM2]|nr:hypothetical protein [Paenibacillus sp. GM2]
MIRMRNYKLLGVLELISTYESMDVSSKVEIHALAAHWVVDI